MANAKAVTSASASHNQKTIIGGRAAKNPNPKEKNTRTKERTITDIIEKVSTWRKLYNGVMVPNPANQEQL